MQVSTDAWHYQLVDLWKMEATDNLCGYFWRFVTALGLSLFFVAIALYLTVLGPVWATYGFFWGHLELVDLLIGWGFYILMAAIFVVSGLVFAFREAPPGSARHVTAERAKAAKDKVCPRIEFKEG